MPKRTKDYHSWLLKRLVEPREAQRYLRVAMEDSPEAFLVALRNVAEARSMTKVAEEADVNRENLYRVLSKDGNPRWDTINSVLKAVGMTLLPTNNQTSLFSGPPPNQGTITATTSVIVAGTSTVNVTGQINTGKIESYVTGKIESYVPSTFGKRSLEVQVAQGNSQLALAA